MRRSPTVEDPSPDPVQKGPELLDQAVGLLQRLTAEVSALKDAPELSSEAEAEIAKLANDIAAAAGAELGDVEKSDTTPIQVATEAVEKLIGVVSALQGAGDEVPDSVCPDMIGVAKARRRWRRL